MKLAFSNTYTSFCKFYNGSVNAKSGKIPVYVFLFHNDNAILYSAILLTTFMFVDTGVLYIFLKRPVHDWDQKQKLLYMKFL